MMDDRGKRPPAGPGHQPRPRPPHRGPSGERARIAGAGDSESVEQLLREFLREIGRTPAEDHPGWAVQTITRDPLRGLFVIAENEADTPLALAAVSTSLDPVRGWSGRLACLYVRPQQRRQGVGRWLLGETLEFARYHGINHLRFETVPGDEASRRTLAELPLVRRNFQIEEIDLRPHFDDGSG